MDNPYNQPAPLPAKILAILLVTIARAPGWWADWRLVRAEEKDARRGRSRWAKALDDADDAVMEAQNRLLGDES